MTIKCNSTGSYDGDVSDYTCTKNCPMPEIPEPTSMTNNWTETTENVEYKDVVR